MLRIDEASSRAFHDGSLSADIKAEQEKLDWADTVVLQFPLWWFGPPAILKGWIDRVFVKGYGYGVRDAAGRVRRYGDGGLAGKRGLVITTIGAAERGFGPRGIHGELDQVLWPLLHGTLWYAGISVLPPVAVYGANHVSADEYAAAVALVRARVRDMASVTPIGYRAESGTEYDTDLVLHKDIARNSTGLGAYLCCQQ